MNRSSVEAQEAALNSNGSNLNDQPNNLSTSILREVHYVFSRQKTNVVVDSESIIKLTKELTERITDKIRNSSKIKRRKSLAPPIESFEPEVTADGRRKQSMQSSMNSRRY